MSLSDIFSGGTAKFVKCGLYPKTRITMDSSGYMQIDSFRKVVECNDIYIKLRSTDMYIEIWGNGLTVSCMSNDSIIVYGKVSSVEFTPAAQMGEGSK